MSVGEPQVGDVLIHGISMLCLVVRVFEDRGGRRMVEVLWLDTGDAHNDLLSTHYGYDGNWKGWKRL